MYVAGWGIAVVAGTAFLAIYENKAGAAASIPYINFSLLHAPEFSGVPALFMFLHPKCPCSAASVEELARLMTECNGRLKAQVLFYQPLDQPDSWSQTSLWQAARAIPGVSVRFDHDAQLARQMGVTTSGQVLFFDQFGRLKFSGGITASRGHAGDNDGVDAIVADVQDSQGSAAHLSRTPVYGCGLYSCPLAEKGKR
jgi:hypothetical protein